LAAGIQSPAVILLACQQLIPPFDIAYFVDTGCEPKPSTPT
jgi:hypothetical protein